MRKGRKDKEHEKENSNNWCRADPEGEDPVLDIDLDEEGWQKRQPEIPGNAPYQRNYVNGLYQDGKSFDLAQVPKNHVHVQPYDVLFGSNLSE